MAKAKMNFKTKLHPLSWVTVRGQGKLKKEDPKKPLDKDDPSSYNYCGTVTLTPEMAEFYKKILDKFWRDNKPAGVGKQKYDVVKEEFKFDLDASGNKKLDGDDEPIKIATGKWTMMAKTLTEWPDGKPNVVKLLGSNGKPLPEGHGLESGCGEGTMGILHCTVGINDFSDNEGLQIYLNGVQIKDSTYTEFVGGNEVDADEIEDDVEDADVESEDPNQDGPEV